MVKSQLFFHAVAVLRNLDRPHREHAMTMAEAWDVRQFQRELAAAGFAELADGSGVEALANPGDNLARLA
jgi:hypothetical protein